MLSVQPNDIHDEHDERKWPSCSPYKLDGLTCRALTAVRSTSALHSKTYTERSSAMIFAKDASDSNAERQFGS